MPFSTRLRSDAGAQATLHEFFRLCDAGGPRCAFSGGAAARFAALARRLRQQPVEIIYDDGTSESSTTRSSSGTRSGRCTTRSAGRTSRSSWPRRGAARRRAPPATVARPASTAAALHAAGRRPAGDRAGVPELPRGLPRRRLRGQHNPRHYAAWSINGALADAQFGYFGRLWTWASSICAEWPGHDEDRYTGPFNRITANPVLVVGNRFDPATRYEGALIVDDLLPRSALLTVEGWGHTSLFLSACADETIARYLIAVATPAPGATCRQDVVPFAGEPCTPHPPQDSSAPLAAAGVTAFAHTHVQSFRTLGRTGGLPTCGAAIPSGRGAACAMTSRSYAPRFSNRSASEAKFGRRPRFAQGSSA